MKKPWERSLPILLIPESMASLELMDQLADSRPGDIIAVPDGFRYTEIDCENLTVKERGFSFELTHEGLKRLA
jgi:hypothetical protein